MFAPPTMEVTGTYSHFAYDLMNYIEFVQRLSNPDWQRDSVWTETSPGEWEVLDATVEALLPPEWVSDPRTLKEMTEVLDNAALNEWSVFTDYLNEHADDTASYTNQQYAVRLFCYVVAWVWQERGRESSSN